jgi:serine protease Do
VGLALAGHGCASRRPGNAADGQAVFHSLQQAAAAAGQTAEASLALIKITSTNTTTQRTMGGVTFNVPNPNASRSTSGLLLSEQGHLLVPEVIKPDEDNQITVLVGEDEYVAYAVKADEPLGMTMLKLDTDDTFTPLDISQGADLAVGEWALVLQPTDEDADYQTLSLLAVCRGEMAGRYRQFLLNQPLNSAAGALVVNLSGEIAGVVDKGSVLAINDLREDLERLLADATGERSPDADKKQKGWLGAILEPINKDYAKARDLPTSALHVLHVVEGAPASVAGLRTGDLITGLNGQPLRLTGSRLMDFFTQSLRPRTGETFALTALRDGLPVELRGTFTQSPEPAILRAEDLGVTVSSITESEVYAQNLATGQGVLVTEVDRGSPAASSGSLRKTLLSKDDIIVEVGGQPTPTIEDFGWVLESIRRDKPPVLLVKYYRGIMTGHAGLNLALGEKENGNKQ